MFGFYSTVLVYACDLYNTQQCDSRCRPKPLSGGASTNTVRTRIIENLVRTLELPLLVRSVYFFSFCLSQMRAERESFRRVFSA